MILSGITIASLTSTGLFDKVEEAKTKTSEKQKEENLRLDEYRDAIAEQVTGNKPEKPFEGSTVAQAIEYEKVLNLSDKTELTDANGNKIVVPAGFKIISNSDTNNATTVDKGIVIEDATGKDTNGSQFVWIPVGSIKKVDGTSTTIDLNRYTFTNNGIPNAQNESVITDENDANSKFQELSKEEIDEFKTSANTNEGFYVGRYESRTVNARNSSDDELKTLTVKKSDNIYNYVTQRQAKEQSKSMYSSAIKSDLINSYAWDTTVLFLQTFGDNDKYSRQNSTTSEYLINGTDDDKQCNVYDMAGNIREWTTEECSDLEYPCTNRGGIANNSNLYTSNRFSSSSTASVAHIGFRTILYF